MTSSYLERFAPFARQMVNQVRIDTVNVKVSTSHGCY